MKILRLNLDTEQINTSIEESPLMAQDIKTKVRPASRVSPEITLSLTEISRITVAGL